MPLAAMVSAVARTTFSLRPLQANLFQLFQPMGGVRARPLSSAWAAAVGSEVIRKKSARKTNQFREPLRCMQTPFEMVGEVYTKRGGEVVSKPIMHGRLCMMGLGGALRRGVFRSRGSAGQGGRRG